MPWATAEAGLDRLYVNDADTARRLLGPQDRQVHIHWDDEGRSYEVIEALHPFLGSAVPDSLRSALADTPGQRLGAKIDALGGKDRWLEDRLAQRTDLLRADIAALKAESAIEQAYGRETAEALRRHIADPNAHGPRAA